MLKNIYEYAILPIVSLNGCGYADDNVISYSLKSTITVKSKDRLRTRLTIEILPYEEEEEEGNYVFVEPEEDSDEFNELRNKIIDSITIRELGGSRGGYTTYHSNLFGDDKPYFNLKVENFTDQTDSGEEYDNVKYTIEIDIATLDQDEKTNIKLAAETLDLTGDRGEIQSEFVETYIHS